MDIGKSEQITCWFPASGADNVDTSDKLDQKRGG